MADTVGGWVVVKSDRRSEFRSALAERAKALKLEIDDDALDTMVTEAVGYAAAGHEFNAAGWGDRIRAAAKPPKNPPPEEDKKPRRGRQGKEPPGGWGPWVGKGESPLDAALSAHRAAVMASDEGIIRLSKTADTLMAGSPQMTRQQAIAQAVASATPGGVSAVIKAVTAALVEGGVMAPGEAQVAAARTVADHLHRQLVARESGVRKEITEDAAAIAADIRIGRVRKALSQDDLAEAVGVSPQTIRSWEAATSLPDPLHSTRLCGVLGLGVEHARRIAKARQSRGQ